MTCTIAVVKDNAYYEQEEMKQSESKAGRKDVENYYSEENESRGKYFGSGAKELDLHFSNKGDLNKLQDGINPATGKELYKKRTSKKKFIDATLSAPKDFSMLAELDQPNRKQYEEIFDRACQKAYQVMEQKTYRVTDRAKTKNYDTQLIGIGYDHKTARPTENRRPDMQWHRHNLISMVARTKDGEFRSLESYGLFNNQKLFGAVFRAELANGLRDLGYEIAPTKELEDPEATGLKRNFVNSFKVVGITDEMRNEFSARNLEINKIANSKNKTTTIDRNNIAQSMKRVKEHWDRLELKAEWFKSAKKVGIKPSTIESWKTFKNATLVKNIKLEDRIIKESLTSKGKLFESKLMLKLTECEQYSGIPAKEYFNKLIEAGVIKRDKGFELQHNIKLENINRNKQYISYKSYSAFRTQFEKKEQKEEKPNQFLELAGLFAGKKFMTMLEVMIWYLFHGEEENKKPYTPNQLRPSAPVKKTPQKEQSLEAINTINSQADKIYSTGYSIADMENELMRSDITMERRYELRAKIDKLYWEQEEARLKAINTDIWKIAPGG